MRRACRAIGIIMPRHEYERVACSLDELAYPTVVADDVGTGKRGRRETCNNCRVELPPLGYKGAKIIALRTHAEPAPETVRFIADLKSEETSLSSVALPPDLRAWLPDPSGDEAYPIVTYTWLLAYKKYADPKIKDAFKGVVQYGLTEGQKFSEELGYIPLPENVVTAVTKALDQIS